MAMEFTTGQRKATCVTAECCAFCMLSTLNTDMPNAQPMKVEQSSEFHAVVASFRTNQAAGSPFQDFEKGSVWLRILKSVSDISFGLTEKPANTGICTSTTSLGDLRAVSLISALRSTGAADLEVLEAGERTPSHVQIPYFPY
eukprot:3576406-Rhodomonas_salina.5